MKTWQIEIKDQWGNWTNDIGENEFATEQEAEDCIPGLDYAFRDDGGIGIYRIVEVEALNEKN